MIDVTGNGNCLFNCFAVLLFGCETNATIIRQVICDDIVTTNYRSNHLILPNGCFADNSHEYVSQIRMREDGTYAGTLEIATFCRLSELDVLVYSVEASEWIWFSSNYNLSLPQVYLQHYRERFQIVSSLSSIITDNSTFEIPTTRGRCLMPPHTSAPPCHSNRIDSGRKTEVQLESFKKSLELFDGELYDPNLNAAYGNVCAKCPRTQTTEYNIDVQVVPLQLDTLKNRQYGQCLKHSTTANLCNNCRRYIYNDPVNIKDS